VLETDIEDVEQALNTRFFSLKREAVIARDSGRTETMPRVASFATAGENKEAGTKRCKCHSANLHYVPVSESSSCLLHAAAL